MDNTLQLIDDVLRERKIRWAQADGLYTLSMGSYPAFIQVESDRDMQVFVREYSDDPETELYIAYVDSDEPFTRDDIWEAIDELLFAYGASVKFMNEIERHFLSIATIVEKQEVSYAITSRLFDKYLGE